jgi:hypothetical protein
MRAVLFFALGMANLGCNRAERDVLREFPAPRLQNQVSGDSQGWRLEPTPTSQLLLQLGDKSAGSVPFEVTRGSLTWSPQTLRGLAGELVFTLDSRSPTEASAHLQRAWGHATPIEGVFRVLELEGQTAAALDLENPDHQSVQLGLRGELEAHGVRSEIQVAVQVEVAAASRRDSHGPALAGPKSRKVSVRCGRSTVVSPFRYQLDLRDPRKPARPLTAIDVGCQLMFAALPTSPAVRAAQENLDK